MQQSSIFFEPKHDFQTILIHSNIINQTKFNIPLHFLLATISPRNQKRIPQNLTFDVQQEKLDFQGEEHLMWMLENDQEKLLFLEVHHPSR